MKYNFDEEINRENTSAIKLEFREKVFGSKDVYPAWVADMDFRGLPEMSEAIINRAKHPIYGYTETPQKYFEGVMNWTSKRYNWEVKKEWIDSSPNVVASINLAIHAYTKPGDNVIVQPPVYYPFFTSIKNNGRIINENQLVKNENRYEIDFDAFEKSIDDRTKMFILCNPHNPVGRVWTKEELTKLGEICLRNNIIIIADEIHSDIIFKDYKYTPMASISEEISNITVTLNSPSKTFNVAGLSTSNVIIENKRLRKEFMSAKQNVGLMLGNIFGMEALIAAYTYGEKWLDELLIYLENNYNYLVDYINNNIPVIKPVKTEGIYLSWLDCSEMGFDNQKSLVDFMVKDAKVGLNNGTVFGSGGEGFMRLNFAMPRRKVEEVLLRIKNAWDQKSK